MTARKILYVTGTRADFGLLQSTLQKLDESPLIDLALLVTGMHLSSAYGSTVEDVQRSGLPIYREIPVDLSESSGVVMSKNLAMMITGFTEALAAAQPDMLLVLGDRGEMLAGAIAALHLNIPVAHIHGGERSGTVDESIRHAISKLSHLHLVTSEDAATRLIRMGERPDTVFVTGAPGLDGLTDLASTSRSDLCRQVGFSTDRKTCLFVFHPVVQEQATAYADSRMILDSLLAHDLQLILVEPNSDAGADEVRRAVDHYRAHPDIRVVPHLTRNLFVSWMANVDVMVGNSSSGIIEAGSFGTPVVNVGSRQNLRLRNANVRDVVCETGELSAALTETLNHGRFAPENAYGDGKAGVRILDILAHAPMTPALLNKANTY